MQMREDTKIMVQEHTAIKATFAELRELVNEIPDGTIYSADLSEVIYDGQENG